MATQLTPQQQAQWNKIINPYGFYPTYNSTRDQIFPTNNKPPVTQTPIAKNSLVQDVSQNTSPVISGGTSALDNLLSLFKQPPQLSMPTLEYTPPSSADLQGKWKEFLDRASRDPDIVGYYKKLLDQAQGDTEIAKGFMEQEYQMGTRFNQENLAATLEGLTGITFPQEQQALETSLNKRGIALTQTPEGKITYAGGGQAGTELANLTESQKLRKEAEQRSSSQGMEQLRLKRTEGLTNVGQQLAQRGLDIQGAKERDIASRAGQYYGFYGAGEQAKLQQAQQKQQQAMYGGGSSSGGDTRLQMLEKMGGTRNPVQEDEYRKLRAGG